MQYTLPKGVFDILPTEKEIWKISDRWQYLEIVARKLALDYGYREIRTPIFEKTELFIRGVGEASDIVSKEMYTFEDRASRLMSLRPEGTAPVMRSVVEKHLHRETSPLKLFYLGPFFRYDRPQAGRFRQFHQLGAEAIGIPDPEQDLELIDMMCEFYRRLGLKEFTLMLNSIGDLSCRHAYIESLKKFLNPHFDQLSKESQVRFTKNPLRILDTKNPKEIELLKKAPSILKFLDEESSEHFEKLCELLKKHKIPYTLNPHLVRGLDYYNKTVFEVSAPALGAQNSIGGGGRFDSLIVDLGGPEIPAIGFSIGLERLLVSMQAQECPFPPPPHPFIFLIPLGDEAKEYCYDLLYNLRHQKIPSEIFTSGKKIQKALQMATTLHANYALIIGDQELKTNKGMLKDLRARTSHEIPFENTLEYIRELWSKN